MPRTASRSSSLLPLWAALSSLLLAACGGSGIIGAGGNGNVGGPCDGGTNPRTWYGDKDGDGLGDPAVTDLTCYAADGFVDNDDDTQPACATNDTDDCGVCAGENGSMDCTGLCGGEAEFDGCGLCSGGSSGHDANSDMDCANECFGDANIDSCGTCSGGNTGLDPVKDPSQCQAAPDLFLDSEYLREEFYVEVLQNIDEDDCRIQEGCLGGPGDRKVVRFGTMIANIGSEDLVIGSPGGNNTNFDWDSCHDHFHFSHYANYELTDVSSGMTAGIGHKNGFCVLDLGTYDNSITQGGCNTYGCGYMGIGVGCYDAYWAGLECQWVDVTDVPDGEYRLSVTTNPDKFMQELRYDNNVGTVRFQMTGDNVTVLGS